MIDVVTILLSLGAVMYIVVRAVILDRERPWFETIGQPDDAPPQAQPAPTGRADRLPAGAVPWRERAALASQRKQGGR
jgi:hypothetical protein